MSVCSGLMSGCLRNCRPDTSGIRNNPLQNKYREKINNGWTEKRADKIFIDFYNNLKMGSNRENLNYIFDKLLENNIQHLSKIRIFDILWWSYLKAE